MSDSSKNFGVLPVLSGSGYKVDLSHLGIKSHSQGEFNGKINYEAVKGPPWWFFRSVKSSNLFFWIFLMFHQETMRTLYYMPTSIWDFEITLNFLIFFEKNLQKPSCRARKTRK